MNFHKSSDCNPVFQSICMTLALHLGFRFHTEKTRNRLLLLFTWPTLNLPSGFISVILLFGKLLLTSRGAGCLLCAYSLKALKAFCYSCLVINFFLFKACASKGKGHVFLPPPCSSEWDSEKEGD